jgi:hypothetical protein
MLPVDVALPIAVRTTRKGGEGTDCKNRYAPETGSIARGMPGYDGEAERGCVRPPPRIPIARNLACPHCGQRPAGLDLSSSFTR